jgi:hypothetical protein
MTKIKKAELTLLCQSGYKTYRGNPHLLLKFLPYWEMPDFANLLSFYKI